ncbi:MAG: hypothetical protein QG670_841 [Thermoproteota archaeon]|nr:hypothetical protein [Thermoproteota archaeon]
MIARNPLAQSLFLTPQSVFISYNFNNECFLSSTDDTAKNLTLQYYHPTSKKRR